MHYSLQTMTDARSTSLTMSAYRTHRNWSMPAFGYKYFATKSTKADGFGTWSAIG
ncbi:MAG: hypothetical protein ACO30Q_03545 [Candidatus Nanopelagicaceae bacterium]|jgi:hypothetical protein